MSFNAYPLTESAPSTGAPSARDHLSVTPSGDQDINIEAYATFEITPSADIDISASGFDDTLTLEGVVDYSGNTVTFDADDFDWVLDEPPTTLPDGKRLFVSGWCSGGKLIATWQIEDDVPGSVTADADGRTLVSTDAGRHYTNEGASAEATFILPVPDASFGPFEFYCHDADGIRIAAPAGATIRLLGDVTPSGGDISSVTVGSYLKVVPINATEYVCQATGTWVVSS